MLKLSAITVALLLVASCATEPARKSQPLDVLAECYVKLGLALGVHDDDYVDAYYGPPVRRIVAEGEALADNVIVDRADDP